jgi:hypothetical protein
LVESCPSRRYTITDPAFSDRCEASRDLAIVVALDLAPRLAQLRLLAATRELVDRALAAGIEREVQGDDSPLIRAFCQVEGELRSEAATILAGFAAVCRGELRLEPETVLCAHLGPLVDQLGLGELEGVKPDKAALAAQKKVFAQRFTRF